MVLGALDAQVNAAAIASGMVASTTDYISLHRGRSQSALQDGQDGVHVAEAWSRALDGLLTSLFAASSALLRQPASGSKHPAFEPTLVAVGSYGRGRVALRSDVDLVLLAPELSCRDGACSHTQAFAEFLLYPLWDSGLEVGHTIQTEAGFLAHALSDLKMATALLDTKIVAGSAGPLASLQTAFAQALAQDEALRRRLLEALAEEVSQRHQRFGDSAFLLEPQLKLARGGLRDADVISWAGHIRWGARGTRRLVAAGAIRESEHLAVRQAADFTWHLRQLIHAMGRMRNDRLSFEDQESIGLRLGFGTSPAEAAERMMQVYYRHAKIVAESCERLLSRALDTTTADTRWELVRDLGTGLKLRTDGVRLKLYVEGGASETLTAAQTLEVVEVARMRPLPLGATLRDALARAWHAESVIAELRESSQAHAVFLQILIARTPAVFARGTLLREVHDLGFITAVVPEFVPLVGKVHFDVYHTYTVDEHSVRALDWLHQLMSGAEAAALPRTTELAAKMADDHVLALGVLFHDIGKNAGREHPEVGAVMAETICPRLGLGAEETAAVAWLVRFHLQLYHWAMRRDVTDPETASEVRAVIPSRGVLDRLFLLTLCDLATTSEKALTPWKLELLTAFYDQASRFLCPDIEEADSETWQARVLAGLPTDIARWVEALIARGGATTLEIFGRIRHRREHADLLICSTSPRGLLPAIAADLEASGVNIVGARSWYDPAAVARRDRSVESTKQRFDLLTVNERSGECWTKERLAEVEAALHATLGAGEMPVLVRARRRMLEVSPPLMRRRLPPIEPRISFERTQRGEAAIIEVRAADSAGLLARLTRVFAEHGLEITYSAVATDGNKVTDVFYVRALAGEFPSDTKVSALCAELRAVL